MGDKEIAEKIVKSTHNCVTIIYDCVTAKDRLIGMVNMV